MNGIAFCLLSNKDDFKVELTYADLGVFILTIDLSIKNVNLVLDISRCLFNLIKKCNSDSNHEHSLPNFGITGWPSHRPHFSRTPNMPTSPLWKVKEIRDAKKLMKKGIALRIKPNIFGDRKKI